VSIVKARSVVVLSNIAPLIAGAVNTGRAIVATIRHPAADRHSNGENTSRDGLGKRQFD
jgi:hypothetical protein